MGVPSFFRWLIKNNDNNIIKRKLDKKINYLMIDCNCLLHPCVAFINKNEIRETRNEIEKLIFKRILLYINDLIQKTKPEQVFIAVDGVVPMGKIMQQRLRRYKNKDMNVNNTIYPLQTLELTVGTEFMEKIHNILKKYSFENNYIYSSFYEKDEGEHKILQFLKKIDNNNIVIYGLDADLLFLSLIDTKNNITIMREEQFLNNMEVEKIKDVIYNYVEIENLHKLIKNFEITTNEFIILCFLVGNDFLPNILTLDIKQNGIMKIITAYKKTNQELIINNKINYETLKQIFKNLLYTENNYLQKTNFITENNYYTYYTNSNTMNTKKRMVKNYIETIEWCFIYYFDKCNSYSHYYKYDTAPLLNDILTFFPEKVEIIPNYITLKPIEQLILTIPKNKYKYVVNEKIIKELEKINFEIGYMFPLNYETDINKNNIEWKQNVRLPNVDYEYYIKMIRSINI